MPDEPVATSKPAKGEKPVGKVEHYYPKAKAAAVGLTDDLKLGDEIHIVGHGDDVRTKVKSLQLDHAPIDAGHAGQHIGVGLAKKVHAGDDVLVVQGAASSGAPKAAGKKAARKKAAGRATKAGKARRPRAKKAARKPKRAAKAGRRKAGRAKRGKRTAAKRSPAKAAKRGKARRR